MRALLEALWAGELDVVIATERLNLRELEYRKLAEETFMLVAGRDALPPVQQTATALEQWA